MSDKNKTVNVIRHLAFEDLGSFAAVLQAHEYRIQNEPGKDGQVITIRSSCDQKTHHNQQNRYGTAVVRGALVHGVAGRCKPAHTHPR